MVMEKICENCFDRFETNYHSVKFCSPKCKAQFRIKNLNEKWEKSETKEKKPISLDHAHRFHAGHAYAKEPTYLKKFKTVRG